MGKGLGRTPKETPAWAQGTFVILGAVFLAHVTVVYISEWYRVIKLVNWVQVLYNYYTFMDKMDNLFEKWM